MPESPPRDRVTSRDASGIENRPTTDEAGLDPSLRATVALVPTSRLTPRRRIATGGMGEVDEADDQVLHRRVAKKTLHAELQSDPRNQRLLVREARVTGQLEHPNIVPVHELGIDSDGRLFFTMKRIEGRTLRDLIAELPSGPFEHTKLLDLLEIVVKVCDALALAHARGVVHCDLKAVNVMVGEFGEVYLMDWGVARLLGPTGAREGFEPVDDGLEPAIDVDQGAISGTPSHMAPEQARSEYERIGPRTDVFAVGAMLYEITTGHPPYAADIVWAMLLKAAMHEYTPIESSERGQALPKTLVSIIERAMSADPEERHPSVTALRDELVRFIRGEPEFPRVRFEAAAAIITEGEPGDAAFRILEGRCDVFRGRGDARSFIRTMGPGETFGEMAILSPGPRTATVVAVTEVLAEVVTREVFVRELSAMKPWLANVVRTLADRFRERGL